MMENNKRFLLAFYVSGEKYSWYIPLFLYFLKRAYPEYFCLIAYKTTISPEVYTSIKMLDGVNAKIYENVFRDYPQERGLRSFLRWVMYFEDFRHFDYICIGDIDIMFVRENPSYLERHLSIMKKYGLIYSNTFDVPQRGKRMSGIHFFETSSYFEKMLPVMEKYRHKLSMPEPIEEFYNPQLKVHDNQFAINVMMEEAGIKIDREAHNYEGTFQYGGIHIGHSRCDGRWDDFFQTDDFQKNYFRKFCRAFSDKLFWKLYFRSPVEIRNEFDEVINSGRKYVCSECVCGQKI